MTKQSLKVVSDSLTDRHDGPEPSLRSSDPVIITAIGRQRVGKTALLNALVQIAQMRGAEVDVWNCDLLNRSHSLTTFHKKTLAPTSGQTKDQRNWIEARFEEQIDSRRDAVLDVGGGWTALHELIEETPLVEILEEANVSLVAIYVLGTEAGDVDYLDTLLNKKMFLPKKSLIVLNEGLVASGRSPAAAFEAIINHPVVRKAQQAGAITEFMPACPAWPLSPIAACRSPTLPMERRRQASLEPRSLTGLAWVAGSSTTCPVSSTPFHPAGFPGCVREGISVLLQLCGADLIG